MTLAETEPVVSSFDWLTFAVALTALLLALATAGFEIYRWRLERDESEPQLRLKVGFTTWSTEVPHVYTTRFDDSRAGEVVQPDEPPSAVSAIATNLGGSGVEVLDVQLVLDGIGYLPNSPGENGQERTTSVFVFDGLPVFVDSRRTARWWWDLRPTVDPGTSSSPEIAKWILNQEREAYIRLVTSMGEVVETKIDTSAWGNPSPARRE